MKLISTKSNKIFAIASVGVAVMAMSSTSYAGGTAAIATEIYRHKSSQERIDAMRGNGKRIDVQVNPETGNYVPNFSGGTNPIQDAANKRMFETTIAGPLFDLNLGEGSSAALYVDTSNGDPATTEEQESCPITSMNYSPHVTSLSAEAVEAQGSLRSYEAAVQAGLASVGISAPALNLEETNAYITAADVDVAKGLQIIAGENGTAAVELLSLDANNNGKPDVLEALITKYRSLSNNPSAQEKAILADLMGQIWAKGGKQALLRAGLTTQEIEDFEKGCKKGMMGA